MTAQPQRIEFSGDLPPEPDLAVWQAWLRHHTIDPNDVAIPGYIGVDPDARQISYLTYERDENGRIRAHPLVGEVVRVVRVVQLEARPSPLPRVPATERG